MERIAIHRLVEWKDSPGRKPLVLKGARQVGKTWLMREFGRQSYRKTFYFSFDREPALSEIFKRSKDPARILEQLGSIRDDKILPGKHLVVLDEIQECPEALNALKYFAEEANEYHVAAAGSLLGTLLSTPQGYPVGKVNLLDVYPMDFGEFLAATSPALARYLRSLKDFSAIPQIQHDKLLEQYRNYLVVGGMPECVGAWAGERDANRVLQIQKELVSLYGNDISKHNGRVNAGRILQVFRSVAPQLAKENEKFVYGCVREGARAREFEEAVEWLVSAGLVVRVRNASKAEHPLNAYAQTNAFKLFFFDTGLLKRISGTSNEAIVLDEEFQFKGPLTENYVMQQLRERYGDSLHYHSPAQNYEIDFLLQDGSKIVPIECKSGKSVGSASFRRYIRENKPGRALRFSSLPFERQETMTNVPLYLAPRIGDILAEP